MLSLSVQKHVNIAAVKLAQAGDGWMLFLANSKDGKLEPVTKNLSKVGVLGQIKDVTTRKNGGLQITFEGYQRFQVTEFHDTEGVMFATGSALLDKSDIDEKTLQSLQDNLQATAIEVLNLLPMDTSKVIDELIKIEDREEVSHAVSQYLHLSRKDAQELLETISTKNRLLRLLELLVARKENIKVESKIQETLSEHVGKRHRDAILREQLKAIQNELGDNKGEGPSSDDYRQKIEAANMPEEAKAVALREVSRLERMGDQSSESHVIRSYLDLLCDMPWEKISDAEIDITTARSTLDRDHYGLKKVKTRLLEHLAVMKLREHKRGSILLLVGPPGVGKTSLGKSIAEGTRKRICASESWWS